jgi:primosomal protein N' (replication factor Y)
MCPFYAEVVIPGIPTPLIYSVPKEFSCNVGYQVLAPNRSRKSKGWVTKLLSFEETKAIIGDVSVVRALQSAIPAFDPSQLEFFNWVSNYYAYPLAETIECALPLLEDKEKRKLKTKIVNRLSVAPTDLFSLTPEQQNAASEIEKSLLQKSGKTFLLFGVTGSGKSEVYFRAVQAAVEADGGAIILVPEIALTPQLIDYFELRLNQSIALLHSDITKAQKQETWSKILSGELKVVLGARSAIFAPVKNLKLIVVDEEHDSSFKQSDTLRYNARDLAVVKSKKENCTVILGSATPSFESLINVKKGAYSLIELKERVNKRPVPDLELINLNKIKKSEMITPNISPAFYEALKPVLESGEQAVILYNRRGFASYLQCLTCQDPIVCPNCSVTLTYHQSKEQLVCHYCGLSQSPPLKCPSCVNPRLSVIEGESEKHGELSRRGAGTESIVEELKSLFPGIPLVQMDRDTVVSKDSYREILGAMKSGRAKLLVGTQMVAKGHDIPGVTFVGIVDADVGLNSPDFRASERTLQLLTQVAGRAGRAERAGRVMLQTRQPAHPAIVAATSGRFLGFAKFELDRRKALDYPPFGRLMRVVVSSTSLLDAQRAADSVGKKIVELIPKAANSIPKQSSFKVLGPAVAPHEKLRGRFRYHLLVKCTSAPALSLLGRLLQQERTGWKEFKDFRLVVDLDPFDML